MKIELLRTEIKKCRKCSLRGGCLQVVADNKEYVVPPLGLMIVGYSPSGHDELLDQAFSKDLNGNFLRNCLHHAGLQPRDVYMTHLIKCRPVIEEVSNAHLNTCKYWLWEQILTIQPKVVVTLGADTSNFILKKTRKMGAMAGKFYTLSSPKVVSRIAPWYSLDYIVSRPQLVDKTIEFLKKVKEKI